MYQFRVKKSDVNIINHLDKIENRNGYIVSLINTDIKNSIYTIKEIKNIIIEETPSIICAEKFLIDSEKDYFSKSMFISNEERKLLERRMQEMGGRKDVQNEFERKNRTVIHPYGGSAKYSTKQKEYSECRQRI